MFFFTFNPRYIDAIFSSTKESADKFTELARKIVLFERFHDIQFHK